MNLRHVASTSGGYGLVRAVASNHSVAGRMHRFVVNAFDERGLIAVCEHTRAVVKQLQLRHS